MPIFTIKSSVFFGKDAHSEASRQMVLKGLKKLVIIVDAGVSGSDAFIKLVSDFEKDGITISTIVPFTATGEPTYDLIDEFTATLRGIEADAFVAVGGGSVMDAVKGAALLITNPGKAVEYRGMDKVRNPGIPVICYPTTAGTGSEVTHTASFIDSGSKTKLGINGKNVSALFGVLMPELTFSCPPNITIFSGLDAMLHAIEAVSAKTASAVTAMMGNKAFSILYKNFQKAVSDPRDYGAREGMLLGSYYAGIAMMNAGGGPASGISYPLGVHYRVPHGLAGGIFLPHVFEYNVSRGYKGYAGTYDELPDADLSLSDEEKSMEFVQKFKQLYNFIGAPVTLSGYGVRKSDAGLLTDLTMEQRRANLELNPVPFGRDEVAALLQEVL